MVLMVDGRGSNPPEKMLELAKLKIHESAVYSLMDSRAIPNSISKGFRGRLSLEMEKLNKKIDTTTGYISAVFGVIKSLPVTF